MHQCTNGDLVVVEDCGAEGKACVVDFVDDTHDFAGCADAQCAEGAGAVCIDAGTTSCDVNFTRSCTLENGCNHWVTTTDCGQSQQTCVYDSNDEAVCG